MQFAIPVTTSLTVNDVRPFIGAKDFDVSRHFYIALGWQLVFDSDDLRVLELEGHKFYLQNYYNQEWCDNTMLHISVRDIQAWHDHVGNIFSTQSLSNIARMSGIKDEGYALVFHIWDPSGILLHIAQFKVL